MDNIDRDGLLALLQEHLEVRVDVIRDKLLHNDDLTVTVAITFAGQVVTADHHSVVLPPLD